MASTGESGGGGGAQDVAAAEFLSRSQPLMETDGAGTGTAERSRHPKAPLSLCARWPGAFGVSVRGPEAGEGKRKRASAKREAAAQPLRGAESRGGSRAARPRKRPARPRF